MLHKIYFNTYSIFVMYVLFQPFVYNCTPFYTNTYVCTYVCKTFLVPLLCSAHCVNFFIVLYSKGGSVGDFFIPFNIAHFLASVCFPSHDQVHFGFLISEHRSKVGNIKMYVLILPRFWNILTFSLVKRITDISTSNSLI